MTTRQAILAAICTLLPLALCVPLWAWDRLSQRAHADAAEQADRQPQAPDAEDEADPDVDRGLDQIQTFLADYRQQRELDLIDDLDLPIKLKQAVRRRVLDGESLAEVYNVNRQQEA